MASGVRWKGEIIPSLTDAALFEVLVFVRSPLARVLAPSEDARQAGVEEILSEIDRRAAEKYRDPRASRLRNPAAA